MKIRSFILAVLLLILFQTSAWADQPINDLKTPVEKIMTLLKASKSQNKEKQEAIRIKVMQIIRDTFDFHEISRRTIARHWKDFSAQQKDEFADIFAEFLGSSYYEKIRDSYTVEDIIYDSEEIVSDNKALVKTRIPRETGDIPIYYRMMLKNGKWKVYDVIIEKISLVKNYRTQFRSILRKESPEQLIERLKKKIEDRKTDQEPGRKNKEKEKPDTQ
ncbi:MAG: ABC transporter substrate-binding protein [Deltaproteobacteria bacterium]|nr:ABC transporter substrate-binding protein [Deltaproteobacteria bacterium]MBW2219404.1 ABC transporter substrate-binding protein [Deltaproteobacteria bacterium]